MSCSTCYSSTSCSTRLSGLCVYYSGSTIVGPNIANGDNFNVVVNKLKNYITASAVGFTASAPLNLSVSNVLTIQQSSSTTDGYLSAANWVTFNAKENPLTFNNGLTRTVNNIAWNGVTGRKNSSDVATRRKINFIDGANTVISVTDNSGADSIDVTIDSFLNIRSISSSGNALISDYTILVNTGSGNITVTVNPSPTRKVFIIKKISSDINSVIISPSSGTIDGASSFSLDNQWDTIMIQSDGTNFYII